MGKKTCMHFHKPMSWSLKDEIPKMREREKRSSDLRRNASLWMHLPNDGFILLRRVGFGFTLRFGRANSGLISSW
jgi:hypothetical protein